MRKLTVTLLCTFSLACSVEHTIAVGTNQLPLTAVPRHRCLAACDHALSTGHLEHPSSAACSIECEEQWSTAEALCPAGAPDLDQMVDCYLASDGTTTPTCQYLFHPSVVQSIDGCPAGAAPAADSAVGAVSGTNCSELPPEADACWFEMTSGGTSESLRVDCSRPTDAGWTCACFVGDDAAFAEVPMDGEPDITWYTRCFSETFMDCFHAGRAVAECAELGPR